MDNREFIEKYKQAILESIAFFSNKHKPDRELWVVGEFLKNLQIKFSKKELTPVTDDPPDVLFNDVKFEVKEIYDGKRHKEYQDALLKCDSVKKSTELLESYTLKHLTVQNVIDITIDKLSKYQNVYSADLKSDLNLLFYFNLVDFHLTDERNYKIHDGLSKHGWRSISVLRDDLSCVIYTSDVAPDFLKTFKEKVVFR